MSVIMYDSDNPDAIPSGVAAAGYVNGYAALAWFARGFTRFPNARRITVFPTDEGDTCDVEWLDLTPEQAPPWVKGRRAAGVLVPWVYCNRSNRPAVERALTLAGILSDQVALWVATLDGTKTVPAGPYPIAAVQYANSAMSGGHYDLSVVNQTFGPGGGSLGGGGFEMQVKPPFTVETQPDTHWFGTPGGQDMGQMGPRTVTVVTVSADGQWFEYPGSTWWFPAAKSLLILPTGTAGPDDDSAYATKAELNAVAAKIPTKGTGTVNVTLS
jgi:hypothetical protein